MILNNQFVLRQFSKNHHTQKGVNMEDYSRMLEFDVKKFVPLESLLGLPLDLLQSWMTLGYVHGYIDDTNHLLIKKIEGEEQILRHVEADMWIQVHPRENVPRIRRMIF